LSLCVENTSLVPACLGSVLFDLKRDPSELHNIAANEPQRCREFQTQLDGWKKAHGPIIKPGQRKQDNIEN
jgi:hypothetical protein